MRIRRVHIENFRAIDQLDLDFGDLNGKALDLAVLAGPNGCGKTSVLEACLIALKQEKLLSRKPPKQDYSIEIEVEADNGKTEKILKTPKQYKPLGSDGNLAFLDIVTQGLRTFYFTSWRAPKLVGGVNLLVGKGSKSSKPDDNMLVRLKHRLVGIRSLAAFKVEAGRRKREADELFGRLDQAWKMFYPEADSHFYADVMPQPQTNNRHGVIEFEEDAETRFDLFYRKNPNSPRISVDDLSSGEIEILSMLGMFIINSNPFDIVFIDEPELHLHPAWHRAMLPALQEVSSGTQFICATHSQDILDSVYSFQRFTLLPSDDLRSGLLQPQQTAREVAE